MIRDCEAWRPDSIEISAQGELNVVIADEFMSAGDIPMTAQLMSNDPNKTAFRALVACHTADDAIVRMING